MIHAALLSIVLLQQPTGGCVLEGVLSLRSPDSELKVTDTVVYLKDGPPNARLSPKTIKVAQREFKFWPRVLVVMLNDNVTFVNEDKNAEHSVFSRLGKDPFPGELNTKTTTYNRSFDREGAAHIQCNIHEDMRADILVLRSSAFSRPDEKGTWSISGLEKKNYTLVAWEPNGGEETREVVCGADKVSLALEGKVRPKPLRRDGSPYPRREYSDTW